MDRVVVGLDGSRSSMAAACWATYVAEQAGWPVRAIWSWQYPATTILPFGSGELPSPVDVEARLRARARELLDEALGERAARFPVEIHRGPAASVLLHAATEDARMVVVGCRGLGGFEELLLGSVSRALVEHAPCPVTVVHGEPSQVHCGVERIIVGVDGSPGAARAQAVAGELAQAVGAQLIVASAVQARDRVRAGHGARGADGQEDGLEAARARVEEWTQPLWDAGLSPEAVAVEGDARTALLELATQRSADLLVIGSRGAGPLTRMLLGSVASSLVHHATLPITVVPSGR